MGLLWVVDKRSMAPPLSSLGHVCRSPRGPKELLGAVSTQLREQSFGDPGPTVTQDTLWLTGSFAFGGNKDDRGIWVVGAYPALS